MSRQPLLLLVFVFYCQICLDALALTVNLKCVDAFRCAIKQQAPSYDKQRQRCRFHWLNQHKQASEEYHRRAYPEPQWHAEHPFGIDQNHKLVYGSEDDYGSEKIHQRLDKQTGHYGQYQTEQHAAYSYNRECRLARYNKSSLSVVNFSV